jgi:pimeloyl-ACP methyl ester carboxylesterase
MRSFLSQIKGPIVLVGHSYGGFVITNAATANPNVKALVYVAAYAPDEGDTGRRPRVNALPKSAQPGAKKALAEIWNAEDKAHAQAAGQRVRRRLRHQVALPAGVARAVSGIRVSRSR